MQELWALQLTLESAAKPPGEDDLINAAEYVHEIARECRKREGHERKGVSGGSVRATFSSQKNVFGVLVSGLAPAQQRVDQPDPGS